MDLKMVTYEKMASDLTLKTLATFVRQRSKRLSKEIQTVLRTNIRTVGA